jgi:hypothetical protein
MLSYANQWVRVPAATGPIAKECDVRMEHHWDKLLNAEITENCHGGRRETT